MSPETAKLVRRSFLKVAPIADDAAKLFYSRLFEIAPEVQPLFKNDMDDQGKKLMKTLAIAVASLEDLETLVPVLQNLAVKHIEYGVQEEHYAVVGEALIWTLEQGLGEAFTAEVKDAWIEVYTIVSTTMIQAAYHKAA